MHQPNKEVEQAREIIRYFVQHPQASDDLEGIARWRLLQERVYRHVEEVHQALELLVQMKLLTRDDTPSSGKRYYLNPERVDESKQFIGLCSGRVRFP